MSDEGAVQSLAPLGKRIERLFYFGSLLLLLGCVNLYFVSVANYTERENLEDIKLLISTITKNFEQLIDLFQNPPKKIGPAKRIVDSDKTTQLRRKLGLPPREEELDSAPSTPIQTYQDLLNKIVDEIQHKARLSRDSLAIVQDTSKSPQEIMSLLEARREQLAKRPVTIWGVESPLILPLEYGGARYQVPASFIAKSLFLALLPLFLGWLGSLYLTRHRELLLIRQLRYYGHTFPHVLNIFPITVRMDEAIESTFRLRNKRKLLVELWIEKLGPSCLRSIVILIFCAPMALVLGYSSIQLFLLPDETSISLVVFFMILFGWILAQIFLLLAQEWTLLWDRSYYA